MPWHIKGRRAPAKQDEADAKYTSTVEAPLLPPGIVLS